MTRSGADGRFEVRATPDGAFADEVASHGGAVTLRVEVANDGQRDPQAVLRVWDHGKWRGADGSVTLQDSTPTAAVRAAAAPSSQLARCLSNVKPGDDTYPNRWTTIGRLNPNRGTLGMFTYGSEQSDEVTFLLNPSFSGVAIGGGQLAGKVRAISETATVRGKGRFRVRAYARYHKQWFRYDRGPRKGELCTPKVQITPDRVYETNLRTDTRVRDRRGVAGGDCRNRKAFPDGHWSDRDPTDIFRRSVGAIESTTLGVNVAGIGFDTQSGFSINVQVAYKFGSRKLNYLICGIGGTVDPGNVAKPSTWSQLWAGA